jgi:hypothetical protein
LLELEIRGHRIMKTNICVTRCKRRTIKIWICLIGIIFLGAIIKVEIHAQEDSALTKEIQLRIINEVRDKLEKVYPYPEVEIRTGNGIYRNFEDDKYSACKTPNDFAKQLSRDLENISNDVHLAIFYDPQMAARIRERQKETQKSSFAALRVEEFRWTNFGFKELKILDGNIGYLDLRTFFPRKYAGETAIASMNFFSNCKALIIDLRNNGGGWDDMVMFLASYFFDRDDPEVISIARSTLDGAYHSSTISSYVSGKNLSDIPIYILTSNRTASAAEAFANIMKHMNENATLVGEKTDGAENPVGRVIICDEYILRIPCWQKMYSATDTGWEGIGVEPDIEVKAKNTLFMAHLDAVKKLSRDCVDEKNTKRYQWAIDGINARNNPINIQ